ncbi:MAG: hypothetical protein WA969_19255 [Candidatus Microthrix parvicella]
MKAEEPLDTQETDHRSGGWLQVPCLLEQQDGQDCQDCRCSEANLWRDGGQHPGRKEERWPRSLTREQDDSPCEQPGHHRIGHIAANGFATDGGCQRTGEERDEPNSSGDFPEEAAQ